MAGRDQGQECAGRQTVVGPDAELVNEEHLWGQIDPHAPVEAMLGLGGAQSSSRSWARTK